MSCNADGASVRHSMRRIIVVIGILFSIFPVFAQEDNGDEGESSRLITLRGSLVASGEYTLQKGEGMLSAYPFNDQFLGRLILNAQLTFSKQVTLPFQLFLTTREVGYTQPFNQFGTQLQLTKWLRLYD